MSPLDGGPGAGGPPGPSPFKPAAAPPPPTDPPAPPLGPPPGPPPGPPSGSPEREVPWSRRRLKKLVPAAIFVLGLFAFQTWRSHRVAEGGVRAEVVWQGETMGTTYTIKVVGPGLTAAKLTGLRGQVDATLATVLRQMSTYDAQSDLSRFNQSRSTAPQPLPAPLLAVVATALDIHRASEGAFDVTVGPLVNAWGFGPDQRGSPPDAAARDRLRALVGSEKLALDLAAGTLAKVHPETYVDLSAIAKGYGVDRVAATVEAAGHTEYMVEIGGEVRTRGRNRTGHPWRIGVERPQELGTTIDRVVLPGDGAMATSGDYRNFIEHEGRRVSHTIDPRTGEPIAHALASVTVFHARCAEADAWATALNVLGPEAGPVLAERLGLAALFLVRQPDGSFAARETSGFAAHQAPGATASGPPGATASGPPGATASGPPEGAAQAPP